MRKTRIPTKKVDVVALLRKLSAMQAALGAKGMCDNNFGQGTQPKKAVRKWYYLSGSSITVTSRLKAFPIQANQWN